MPRHSALAPLWCVSLALLTSISALAKSAETQKDAPRSAARSSATQQGAIKSTPPGKAKPAKAADAPKTPGNKASEAKSPSVKRVVDGQAAALSPRAAKPEAVGRAKATSAVQADKRRADPRDKSSSVQASEKGRVQAPRAEADTEASLPAASPEWEKAAGRDVTVAGKRASATNKDVAAKKSDVATSKDVAVSKASPAKNDLASAKVAPSKDVAVSKASPAKNEVASAKVAPSKGIAAKPSEIAVSKVVAAGNGEIALAKAVPAGKEVAVKAPPAPPPPPRVVIPAGELQRMGSLSIGKPNTGYLVNAVPMPMHQDWVLSVPDHRFGTAEAVTQLQHCLHKVHTEFPGSPRVVLGSMSAMHGGFLPPHKSHRTGRDVDVYFFRKPDTTWNRNAKREDIDLPRTWALLRCFVAETDVDMVLIDHTVQGWLEDYALSINEPAQWVHDLFHDKANSCCAPVRHVPGHGAHMHVRFSSPVARQRGVQNYDRLVAAGIVPRKIAPLDYTVAKGDTLIGVAKRHQVTVDALKANNPQLGKVLRIGQVVTLQHAVDIEGSKDPVWVPPRHVRPLPGRDSASAVAMLASPPIARASGAVMPRTVLNPVSLSAATPSAVQDALNELAGEDESHVAEQAPGAAVPGPPPRVERGDETAAVARQRDWKSVSLRELARDGDS